MPRSALAPREVAERRRCAREARAPALAAPTVEDSASFRVHRSGAGHAVGLGALGAGDRRRQPRRNQKTSAVHTTIGARVRACEVEADARAPSPTRLSRRAPSSRAAEASSDFSGDREAGGGAASDEPGSQQITPSHAGSAEVVAHA